MLLHVGRICRTVVVLGVELLLGDAEVVGRCQELLHDVGVAVVSRPRGRIPCASCGGHSAMPRPPKKGRKTDLLVTEDGKTYQQHPQRG